MKILVVDDERDLTELLSFALQRAGYEVVAAHDGATAIRLLQRQPLDLMVLDVNLAGVDGFDVLRDARQFSHLPVIMLTSRLAEADRVRGLETGADDYVTKPFSFKELLARITAQLRRATEFAPARVAPEEHAVGSLRLDARRHVVTKSGQTLDLTLTEFRLLHYLMANPDVVLPTDGLLRQVWGYDDASAHNVVRTAVHRLRQKIEDDPAQPRYLRTVAGVGFILQAA